jgi:hypothetical protein
MKIQFQQFSKKKHHRLMGDLNQKENVKPMIPNSYSLKKAIP